MPDEALVRWCERVGIACAYDDIWGQRHVVPEAGLRAVLGEFGVESPDAPSLAQAEAGDWRVAMPPVVALAAEAPRFELIVRVPAALSWLRWTLHEEGGAQHTGETEAAACEELAQASVAGRAMRALRLAIERPLPAGYHRFALHPEGLDGASCEALLVAAPPHCYRPDSLHGDGRVWGPAVQLYALRSERNWGMGDFGDLSVLVETFAERGAGIVGLNPLHALFPHNPAHASPYSPSSRSQLNVLYLDVEAIDDFRECEPVQRRVREAAFQQRLARLRAAEQVDYAGVAAAKFEVLERLYAHFRERHLHTASARGRAFRTFQAERGPALRWHASFEALQARFHGADSAVWGWPVWPPEYRDAQAPAVQRFQAEHAERIEYFEYLQWQADLQLGAIARRCRERGVAVGLYLDLAVSVDRAGSDAWAHDALYARGASVGAPPDEFNPNGQDWGLPPLRPDRLAEERCRFFIDTLRACMRHAGALRIDHVMGLMRLYWVPGGHDAREGAYVRYPLPELMAIVTLESERNRCMVIGEDLGTVADEMRAALARNELLSYRLLYFERGDDGAFKPPQAYPREALVAVSTHDLPTLAGWWGGHDLQVRARLGLYANPDQLAQQQAARALDRERLLRALQRAGLLGEGAQAAAEAALTQELVEAVHAYVAMAPARVMVMQLEDALGVLDQPNLPGTVDEHPNWRRKLPLALPALAADARVQALSTRLAHLRPHAPLRTPAQPRAEATVPRATYRLQFHAGFGFDDALQVLPYLQRLGVSHVYCSPLTRARAGSLHGYDVVAHDEINPELGGRAGFERFRAAARAQGLGLLLDLVPNHMGIGGDNAWWMDVLENGPASLYARYFDIDWQPVDRALEGKVLLPVLGEHFGRVLEDGRLQLRLDAARGAIELHYEEHRFPLDPRSLAPLLHRAAQRSGPGLSAALQSLAEGFERLPARDVEVLQARLQRAHDKEALKSKLAALLHADDAARGALQAELEAQDADGLEALHEAQAYRLAYWRVASDEINYRRFFDINELAALRVEEPAVFEATHGFALELAAAQAVDGLRIDHPDGLLDPAQYFERLQRGYAHRAGVVLPAQDAHARPPRPLYVVAEKIAAAHEDVPQRWALHGTTGYRFANVANGVLVDGDARARMDRIWRGFSGQAQDFDELAHDGKRAIQRSSLASELTVLAGELLRVARAHRRTRDYTFNALREALAEVAACMPVYRTYIVDQPSPQDRRYIDWAVAQARRRGHAADTTVFDFVHRTLLAQAEEGAPDSLRERVRRFALRFQQFSAPVAAKGVEDTAFYRYSRLVSLNEVGGDPGSFGVSVRGLHGANADRAAHWPHTILATSTHDSKRSEDVRARLDVLSEMPAAWRLWLRRFGAAPQLPRAAGPEPMPSRADQALLLQTLLGTLPAGGLDEEGLGSYRERIERYMLKAAREAKLHTSWISPDSDYEDALLAMVRSALARVKPNPLLTELHTQAEVLAWFGALNSLTLVLLKFTAPGVPDLYQGSELMEFNLVDPDNRRPVDYALRRRALDELEALSRGADWRTGLATLAAAPHDGRLKLWLTWRLLQLRRGHEALFRDAGYAALAVHGQHREHVIAYAREAPQGRVLTVAGRLFARLLDAQPVLPLGDAVWRDTAVELPDEDDGSRWLNVLTGEMLTVRNGRLHLAALFATVPAAALLRSTDA